MINRQIHVGISSVRAHPLVVVDMPTPACSLRAHVPAAAAFQAERRVWARCGACLMCILLSVCLPRCVDIPLVSKLCHAAGAVVCIDSTFATPINQRALDMGADIVIHSATKYLAGERRRDAQTDKTSKSTAKKQSPRPPPASTWEAGKAWGAGCVPAPATITTPVTGPPW
jgi:Cys/Met metabolism PLP-dependent enzyme